MGWQGQEGDSDAAYLGGTLPRVLACHSQESGCVTWLCPLLYLHLLQRRKITLSWSLQERVMSALQLQERARQFPMEIGQSSSEKRLCQGGSLVNLGGGVASLAVVVNP